MFLSVTLAEKASRPDDPLPVHGERALLMPPFFIGLASVRVVEGLEPDVAESDVRISVLLVHRLRDDALELLLSRAQLLLGEMEKANQGPRVGMILEGIDEMCAIGRERRRSK